MSEALAASYRSAVMPVCRRASSRRMPPVSEQMATRTSCSSSDRSPGSSRVTLSAAVGDRLRVDVPQAALEIGGLAVSVGAGGLHSVDQARVYYSTRKYRLVSVDVASFYPSLIATKGIAPRSYGDTGA